MSEKGQDNEEQRAAKEACNLKDESCKEEERGGGCISF